MRDGDEDIVERERERERGDLGEREQGARERK